MGFETHVGKQKDIPENQDADQYVKHLVAQVTRTLFRQHKIRLLLSRIIPLDSENMAQRLKNACAGYEQLYLNYKVKPEDFVKALVDVMPGPATQTSPIFKERLTLSGAPLLSRIINMRERTAETRVGLWHESPDHKFAVLQHYYPKDIQKRGKGMDNCMQGLVEGRFKAVHLVGMLERTRMYDELGAPRTPHTMLLTVNKIDTERYADELDGILPNSNERFINSEPIVMVEYDTRTPAIVELKGVANRHADSGAFQILLDYTKRPLEETRAIGMCVRELIRLNPFVTMDRKVLGSDKIPKRNHALTIEGASNLLFENNKPALRPEDAIFAGGVFVTPIMPLEHLTYLSKFYGIVLTMTTATERQRKCLTIVRGDIMDASKKPSYPSLLQARKIVLAHGQPLSVFAPRLSKIAVTQGFDVSKPFSSYIGSDLIPLELAIEQDRSID